MRKPSEPVSTCTLSIVWHWFVFGTQTVTLVISMFAAPVMPADAVTGCTFAALDGVTPVPFGFDVVEPPPPPPHAASVAASAAVYHAILRGMAVSSPQVVDRHAGRHRAGQPRAAHIRAHAAAGFDDEVGLRDAPGVEARAGVRVRRDGVALEGREAFAEQFPQVRRRRAVPCVSEDESGARRVLVNRRAAGVDIAAHRDGTVRQRR
ncbi:hypothetical protein DP49_5139 [Burkholderia pseudomallei]|nr:hypothetical protein DP49_5139 [Burkholderia pseudomallei]